jgi:hypothetical protein
LLRNSLASLPAAVVFPEPCSPINMITRGLGPERFSAEGSPSVAINSSLTILMICWPGLSAFETCSPTAPRRTRARKSLTTL